MEASKVLQIVRKWLWLIVLGALIGGAAGLVVSLVQPKIYEADTTLYVNSPGRTDYQAVTGDQEAAKALAQIPQSHSILAATLRAVGDRSLSLIRLSSMVTVTNTLNTQYVTIGVRDSNPQRAARLATEIANRSITQFETATNGGDQTNQIVKQQMNDLDKEIKNLEKQLAAAQRQAATSTPTPSNILTPTPTNIVTPTPTVSIDQLNTRLNEDRTLYNQLLTTLTTMSSTQVTVVQPADIPQNPVGLGKTVAVAMGTLAALIVIVGLIILIEQTDQVLRTPEKVSRATGLSTLMTIAYQPTIAKLFPLLNAHDEVTKNGHQQVIDDAETVKLEPAMVKQARLLARRSELTKDTLQEDDDLAEAPGASWIEGHKEAAEDIINGLSSRVKRELEGIASFKVSDKGVNGYQLPEEFLTLGVLLDDENGQLASNGGNIRSLLITSPESGDGKTSVASQIALGLARIGTQVVLVDANMRKPAVHNVFNLSKRVGLSNKVGLSSILVSGMKVDGYSIFDALQKTDEPNLTILPSGPMIDSSSRLLSSLRMTALLELLREKAFIVIDSPAALTSSDAVILAKKCDGVLMVVDARRTTADRLKQALETVTRVNMSILGVVLNRSNN